MSLNAGADTLRGFFDKISRDDDRHPPPVISAPTVLISGTPSQEVPSEVGLYMRRHIAKARLVELPGVDHFAFASHASLINASIEAFAKD
jgi:pimeloyl-ACP methyl ester carboxylesterase